MDTGSAAQKRLHIGTHDGRFHADEALACFLVMRLPVYADALITRSRDPAVHAKMDMLVDVGGIYDPSTHRYDHHQRGFNETFSAKFSRTKLSSAGLVYKHFGRQIIKHELALTSPDKSLLDTIETQADIFYERIYEDLVEEFDANDNGISAYPSDIQPLFKTGATDVFTRVGSLNPDWNAAPGQTGPEATMLAFREAVALAGSFFLDQVNYLAHSWWPARNIVRQAFGDRLAYDQQGRVLLLSTPCPWKDHLFSLEEAEQQQQQKDSSQVFYVIYPDTVHDQWMVQAVSVHSKSFTSRKPLPESWHGLRDARLDTVSGIANCVFVHASGFIGGNKTKSGALEMAFYALSH